jgi:hypothetical protein
MDDAKIVALSQGPYKQSKAVSPHREPLKALKLLLSDYQGYFEQLSARKELTIGSTDKALIRERFKALHQRIEEAEATPTPFVLKIMQEEAQRLTKATSSWLCQEEVLHPYRAQFLMDFGSRINTLSGILAARADLPNTANWLLPETKTSQANSSFIK